MAIKYKVCRVAIRTIIHKPSPCLVLLQQCVRVRGCDRGGPLTEGGRQSHSPSTHEYCAALTILQHAQPHLHHTTVLHETVDTGQKQQLTT